MLAKIADSSVFSDFSANGFSIFLLKLMFPLVLDSGVDNCYQYFPPSQFHLPAVSCGRVYFPALLMLGLAM